MSTMDIITVAVAAITALLWVPIIRFLLSALSAWMQRSALAKVLSLSIKHPSLARALIMVCITVHWPWAAK